MINTRFKLFIFVLCVSGLFSCGTKKQATDISIDNELRREIEEVVEDFMNRRIVEIKTSDLIADILIKEREFDTDKPIDSETGERPIKKVTDTTINIQRADSTITSDSTYIKDNKVVNITQDDKIRQDESTEVTSKESRWPVVFICLSVLAGIMAIIYILRKVGVF